MKQPGFITPPQDVRFLEAFNLAMEFAGHLRSRFGLNDDELSELFRRLHVCVEASLGRKEPQ